jgi:ketosteroid isomerase-like protein
MAHPSFDSFMQARRRVAAAYANGDPKPLSEISAENDPATFFGPGGGVEQGAAHVLKVNEAGSHMFKEGGTTELEVLHSGSDGEFGYWTGFQNASVRTDGKSEPTSMKLRVTEIFRRENGEWKLIHRHADPLAEKQRKH